MQGVMTTLSVFSAEYSLAALVKMDKMAHRIKRSVIPRLGVPMLDYIYSLIYC